MNIMLVFTPTIMIHINPNLHVCEIWVKKKHYSGYIKSLKHYNKLLILISVHKGTASRGKSKLIFTPLTSFSGYKEPQTLNNSYV